MFRMLGAAVAAVSLSLAGSATGAVIVDFDSLTAGQTYDVGQNLVGGGVKDASDAISVPGVILSGGLFPHGPTSILGPTDPDASGVGGNEVKANGSAIGGRPGLSASYVGDYLSIKLNAKEITSIRFYLQTESSGQHQYTFTTDNDISTMETFYFPLINGSHRLTSFTIQAPTSFTFDDLTIDNVSAVPEPTTWAMMIAGFAGTGAMVRRSRRRLTYVKAPADFPNVPPNEPAFSIPSSHAAALPLR